MTMSTHVNFDGRCAEAFRYYEHHLGGSIGTMMADDEAPDAAAAKLGSNETVRYADIQIGAATLMGSDVPGAEPMRSAYLTLYADSDAHAERIYAALADGGEVFHEMMETFFATRFGQLRDRFGINWTIVSRAES